MRALAAVRALGGAMAVAVAFILGNPTTAPQQAKPISVRNPQRAPTLALSDGVPRAPDDKGPAPASPPIVSGKLVVGHGDGEHVVRITDNQGKPLAGAGVGSPMQVLPRGVAATSITGHIVIRGVEGQTPVDLIVAPPPERADLAPVRILWTPDRTDLVLPPGHVVRGRVTSPQGDPIPNAIVHIKTTVSDWKGLGSSRDGRFEFAGIPGGAVELRGESGAGMGEIVRVDDVTQLTDELVLVAPIGGVLRLLVEDFGSDLRREATLREMSGAGAPLEAGIARNGEIIFTGLDERSSYRLYIPPLTGNRFVHRTQLRAGPGIESVTPEVGMPIRGYVIPVEGLLPRTVFANAYGLGLSRLARVGKDGGFEVTGLPDVEVRVGATLMIEGIKHHGFAPARPGDRVTIVLSPAR